MHPQAMRVMQRFVGTPLGHAVVQLLIAWLVLQPLWEVGEHMARDTTPLPEVVAWVWRLIRPGAAHATSVTEIGPAHTLPGTQPLSLLPDAASPSRIATDSSLFVADLKHHVAVAAAVDAPLAGATTSLTGALTVFGPKDYVRSRGTPVTVTDTFRVAAPPMTATLRIDNRGLQGQYDPVSSAVITLNGTVIVAPNAFNPQVTVIEKPVPLLSQNILSVEVRSKPGSGFTLQILGVLTNTPPVAHAGPDQTVVMGQTVHLDGSRSSDHDGDMLTYRWALVAVSPGSQATLANPTAVTPTFVVDLPGRYEAQLIVHDGLVASAPDTVALTTVNSLPTAHAGADHTALVTETVTLDGSKSSDVDGDLLTYRWSLLTQPPGSHTILSDPGAVKPTVQVDAAGTYEVQLIVNDGHGDSAPDTVLITTLNSAPVADAGPDHLVLVRRTVTLDGRKSSDVDGDLLTYRWSFLSRPPDSTATLADPGAVQPTFSPDTPGTYVAQLIVNDSQVDSLPDTVQLLTTNTAPVANAGPDQSVGVGQQVHLDGSQSTDVDGDPLTYFWSFSAMPTGSATALSDVTVVDPLFLVDQPGTYVLQLLVHDSQVESTPDTVVISTHNSKPVANAGPDQQVTVGDTVTLDGSGSSDADGDPLLAQWAFLTRPVDSTATLSDALARQPTFVADLAGLYVLQLIVRDGHEASEPDTMIVTAAQPNRPPVITSTPLTTAMVGQPYSYGVQATDPDAGDTLTFALTTAPTGMTIDATTGLIQWTPSSAQVGSQPVTVRVHDTEGLAATQSFTITVSQPNRPPLITSSPGITATAGQPYSYTVVATDPDVGDVLTFALTTPPPGMSITPGTGLLQWTPDVTQVGSQPVTVRVQDQGGLVAEQHFTLAVGLPTVNHPPQITSTPLTTASAEQPYSYDVEATDPDVGDILTFALSTAPTGMTIGPATSLIQWTPTASHVGSQNVTVRVEDVGGLFTTQSFPVTVTSSSPTCVPPPPGLIGWWPGDGDATDRAGGHDGMLQNGTTFAPGMVVHALRFDGVDDAVQVAANPQLHPSAITIDAWVQATVLDNPSSNGSPFLIGSNRSTSDVDGYQLQLEFTGRVVFVIGGGTRRTVYASTAGDIVAKQWYHVAVTYDGIGGPGSLQLYINGVQKPFMLEQCCGIQEPTGPIFYADDSPLSMGRRSSDGINKFNGLLDEVEIFNRVLTAQEIQAIFAAGSAGKCKAPPGNRPPTILSTSVATATVGQAYTYDVDASDPDVGDVLTFALTTAPSGMIINAATGLLQWTPTTAHIGTHEVTVRTHDPGGLAATQTFTVLVTASPLACLPPPPGIVSWWPGDGNAHDIVDSNTGTLEAGATFATGHVGPAFRFDKVNDFVFVPNNANLAVGERQDFTLEAWINLQSPVPGTDDWILQKGDTRKTAQGLTLHAYSLSVRRAVVYLQPADNSVA